ncbi:hypothetical protein OSB04_016851 [Centaurea solstitialis]|uniref:CCHC-type domain-containing protein n=1 Tax=Centaurea solstitialis TaxID=347529 RepID=A0AA38TCT8_9ASTR|nr:hypothetical protein OSB04_016851 [Centaurea solstitialis]
MMSEHDSSSKIPTAQTIGDVNSKSEEDVQQDIGKDDEAQLSPRTERVQFAQRFVPSEKDKINHFVTGLRRNIRDFLTNRDISSFTKAVEYARKREHDLSLPDDSDVPEKRTRVEKTFSTPTSKSSRFFTPRRAQSQNTPHTTSRAYTIQSNASRNCNRCGKSHQGRCGGDQNFLRCFCCGEDGHVRTQCPQKERSCYYCGLLGHRIRECPKNRPEESRGSVQQPRQRLIQTTGASTKKDEVPKPRARAFQITAEEAINDPDVVTGIFLVNSQPARILFDSGATNSFMSHDYVRYMKSVPFILLLDAKSDSIRDHKLVLKVKTKAKSKWLIKSKFTSIVYFLYMLFVIVLYC